MKKNEIKLSLLFSFMILFLGFQSCTGKKAADTNVDQGEVINESEENLDTIVDIEIDVTGEDSLDIEIIEEVEVDQ